MNDFKILSGSNIFLYSCDFGDGIAIGFNGGRHFIVMGAGDYAIYPFHSSMLRITCELISCKREDLKLNGTAFCTISELPQIDDLNCYCKILEESKFVYVDHGDFVRESNADPSQFNWWKVQPLNK